MLGIGRRQHERELADALAASLDAVQSGAASVDDCLRRYAPLAAELEPLLRTSARLRTALHSEPSEAARLRARAAFLAAAAQRRPANVTPHPMVRRRAWVAFVPAAIAAALFAAIAVPVLGSMDSGATPGDWNYGFKRATERVRLALTTDSADRRTLRLEFAKRRLDEIERLSTTGHIERHASQVKTLFVEYTSDIQQVKDGLQSVPTLPVSEKQQIDSVSEKFSTVVTTVQSAAPTDQSVQDAAQQAQTATQATTNIAQTIPSTSKPAAVTVSPTRPSHPQTALTTPTDTNTPAPTAATSPAETATATGTPPATATPSPTATASSTTTPAPATASATASPTSAGPLTAVNITPIVETTPPPPRSVATVPVIVPSSPLTSSPAASAAESPDGTATPRTIGAPAGAGSTTAPRTATPPSTATATPPPAAPRVATLTPSLIMINTGPDGTSYRWQGPPTPLDAVLPLPVSQVAVVYYAEQNGTTRSWYPGTPAPTITSGTTFTVKQRSTPPR